MKKLLIIPICFILMACSAQLQTAAGPIDFELTPEMVDRIFDIATRDGRGAGCQIQGIMARGKLIAIVDDVDDLQTWGGADGVLTEKEAIFIKSMLPDDGKGHFIFTNSQGDRFKILK